MPWLVSMRMIGQVIGARATVATRKSVIFRSDGFEFVLTFCGSASSVSSSHALSRAVGHAAAAPAAPAIFPRNARRFERSISMLLVGPAEAGPYVRETHHVRQTHVGAGFRRPEKLSGERRLHHCSRVADVVRVGRVPAAAGILRFEGRPFLVV